MTLKEYKELIRVFQKMGASIEIDEEGKKAHVEKNSPLHGTSVDINDFVDGIAILSLSLFCRGGNH